MPADGRPCALRVGDHPLLECLCSTSSGSAPLRSIGSGLFCPLANMPYAHKLDHVRLWQPIGNKDGSCECATGLRRMQNAAAVCTHACITLRRFCIALDTRTQHNACEHLHMCARMPARCSARMYTSTHASTHTRMPCMVWYKHSCQFTLHKRTANDARIHTHARTHPHTPHARHTI